MSGVSLKKVIKDVHQMLKSTKPKNSKSNYFDLLKEQAFSEGTWNDDFISEIKSKILSYLNKYSDNEIKSLWEDTEISMNTIADPDSIPAIKLRDDVGEELLNTVFDSLDERTFSEPIFQSNYVSENDDDFDDDELDGFSDDNPEESDENFEDEKF